LEKAVSLYDRPHRLAFSFNYVLPLFRTQRGIAGHVLGGWQLAGIASIESGVPVNVINGSDSDGLGGVDRPLYNPRGQADVRAQPNPASSTGYINPDAIINGRVTAVEIDPLEARYIGIPAFRVGAPPVIGDSPRNPTRTPGLRTTDLNVFKNFRLHERVTLEFRTEFYNLFNNSTPGVSSNSPFAPFAGTPASAVNASLPGRFLRHSAQMDGGGRMIRYQLNLRF
jgi:hypothetical protein